MVDGVDASGWASTAVARGRAAWPELAIPDELFADYLRARAGPDRLPALHVEDLYLACGCSQGDPRALRFFDRDYLKPVEANLRRSGIVPMEAGEITQSLRSKLLVGEEARPPGIFDYQGTGSLEGWIWVAATRIAFRLRRDDRARTRAAAEGTPSLLSTAGPDEAAFRERFGPQFSEAFRDAFRSLDAEERVVLRLHFAEGLNLDRVATALGFARATAGRRVQSARMRLRDRTLALLEERLRLEPAELAGVLADLRSRLEISFGAFVTTI